jgi:hypothetical protein
MTRGIGIRPIIFSVNCYIATILAMFIAFRLDCGVRSSSETKTQSANQTIIASVVSSGALARLGTMAILV